MKGWIVGSLAVLLWLTVACMAYAGGNSIPTQVPEVVVIHGTGMVPLAPLAELMDATLTQGPTAQEVTLARRGMSFSCMSGKLAAQQNGRAVKLPLAPFQRYGITYAPLRPCIEALGGALLLTLEGTVKISLPGMDEPLVANMNSMEGDVSDFHDMDAELLLVNLDGSGQRRITYTYTDEEYPVFAPHSDMLFYIACGDLSAWNITTQEYGYLPAEETEGGLIYFSAPKFSPVGLPIVFERFGYEDNITRIGTIADDGRIITLAKGDNSCISPDGKTIAFNTEDEKTQQIVVRLMDFEGNSLKTLGEGCRPIFSPDGSVLIATRNYAGRADEKYQGLITYILQGKDAGKVLVPPQNDRVWHEECGGFSPDGSKVLLIRQNEGIFSMDPDRNNIKQLYYCPQDITFAIYTPDGTHILFAVSDGAIENHLCIMEADGRNPKRLTQPGTPRLILSYTLTPDGTQVLCEAYP